MTLTVWVPEAEGKEVFTAKTDSGYVGCVRTCEYMLITPQVYEKPLVAANAARKLKKSFCSQSSDKQIKSVKQVATKKTKIKSRVKLTGKLYTNDEREAMPLLSFTEVWVISRGEEYVLDCLNKEKKLLCSYTKDRQKAKRFKDYEEAARISRVLKSSVGPGFDCSRFWLRID
jgi:hypothetical protein|tara:strand:- start:1580 stop:2098 length:519 start_codon:yes stop_codon:yes gene_type:complete